MSQDNVSQEIPPVEGLDNSSLDTNQTQYNEVYVENDSYDEGFPINTEVVYLTIPISYIPIYRRLLHLVAAGGKAILDDCSYGCKGNGSVVFNCWNIFQSACAAYAVGDNEKAKLFIDYVDKQISNYNRSNGIKDNDTSFKYVITPDGQVKADGVITDNVVSLTLDKENKEGYDNYQVNKDNGKVFVEGE